MTVDNSDATVDTTSVEFAAKGIEGLFSATPEDRKSATPTAKGSDTSHSEDSDDADDALDDADETDTDATEDATDDAEADEDTATEDESEESEDENTDDAERAATSAHKVKINGQEVEVTLDELKRGYSRTEDYTRKTQAHAEAVKTFEKDVVTPLRAERQQYNESLGKLETILTTLMPDKEPDWAALRETLPPDEFTAQLLSYQKGQESLKKVQAERAAISEKEQADAREQFLTNLKAEEQKMLEVFPEWKDPTKLAKGQTKLREYAKSMQFTDEQIAGIADHRLMVLLDKARRFDLGEAKRPAIKNKIDNAIKSTKAPQKAASRDAKSTEFGKLKGKAARTGRVEDAADAIEAILG
jgi:hypothetical protein